MARREHGDGFYRDPPHRHIRIRRSCPGSPLPATGLPKDRLKADRCRHCNGSDTSPPSSSSFDPRKQNGTHPFRVLTPPSPQRGRRPRDRQIVSRTAKRESRRHATCEAGGRNGHPVQPLSSSRCCRSEEAVSRPNLPATKVRKSSRYSTGTHPRLSLPSRISPRR